MSQEQHSEELHQDNPNPAIEAITALAERWPRFRFRQKDEDGLIWEENVDFEKGFYKLRLSWLPKNGVIKLICRWPILIPSENFAKLALKIGKINFGVRVGKFEFDERDGELCLRHSFILGEKYLQLTSIDQRNVLYCNMFVLCHELMETHWDSLVRLSTRTSDEEDEEENHAGAAGHGGSSFVLLPHQIDEGDDICDGTMGNVARASIQNSEGAFVTKHMKPRKNFGPEEKATFLHEAGDAAALHHPNICPVRICLEPPQLVSPFYEAGNLQKVLEENKTTKLPQERVYSILLDIARAINYLHDCGIVHGRIKPQNLLVGAKGDVVLSDTGFPQTRKTILDGQTAPGENGALYAAPELLFGKPLSPGTDVFALGIIHFQFMMPNAELLPPVVPELISFDDSIPQPVQKLIRECLHRDASKRPPIIDVIASLRQLAAAK